MPIDPVLGTLGGSVINAVSNIGANKANRKWQEEFWNKQNDYNHPSAQMARLQEAGLNPNLIYGKNASGASGNSASPIKAERKKVTPDVVNTLLQSQSMKQAQAQLNATREQANLIKAQTFQAKTNAILNSANTANVTSRTLGQGTANELASRGLESQLQALTQIGYQQKIKTNQMGLDLYQSTPRFQLDQDKKTSEIALNKSKLTGQNLLNKITTLKETIWREQGRNPNHQVTWESVAGRFLEQYGEKAARDFIEWAKNATSTPELTGAIAGIKLYLGIK